MTAGHEAMYDVGDAARHCRHTAAAQKDVDLNQSRYRFLLPQDTVRPKSTVFSGRK